MDDMGRRYRRSPNMVYRQIEAESLLVPIKSNVGDMGFIYNLNDVGTFIWDRLDGENQLGDITNQIVEEFDVSPAEAQEDLLHFTAQLKKIGAIEAVC